MMVRCSSTGSMLEMMKDKEEKMCQKAETHPALWSDSCHVGE